MENIVKLNVGGTVYTTSKSTLTYPDSMLARMFSGDLPTAKDEHGNYFIDRNGKMFEIVLEYLRNGKLLLKQNFNNFDQLKAEADFYQIGTMLTEIEKYESAKLQEEELTKSKSLLMRKCTIVFVIEDASTQKYKNISVRWQKSVYAKQLLSRWSAEADTMKDNAAFIECKAARREGYQDFSSRSDALYFLASVGARKIDTDVYEAQLFD